MSASLSLPLHFLSIYSMHFRNYNLRKTSYTISTLVQMKNIQKRQVCWYVVSLGQQNCSSCIFGVKLDPAADRQRQYSPLKQPATARTMTHFHTPQDLNLQQHYCENLRSPKTFLLLICTWSEHQDAEAHWLSVSMKWTIFCKPHSTHRSIRHTKFLVYRVGVEELFTR